ncbi:isoprenyl transferase [Elusimicrobiota bacterium]
MSLKENIDYSNLPNHIAIVMDGNGRWAKKRRLPRIFGHREGVKTVKKIIKSCSNLGIKYLTLYAFSTENWTRPKNEISGLMKLLQKYLRAELNGMKKNNIRFRTIGDLSALPEFVRKELENCINQTQNNSGLVLNIALNYGSRQEIIRAISRLSGKNIKKIDEKAVSDNLDTAGIPDPDLFIRTSGEMRISNFLLWQMAYTELYITSILWPDFLPDRLYEAIVDYQKRDRRFGGI